MLFGENKENGQNKDIEFTKEVTALIRTNNFVKKFLQNFLNCFLLFLLCETMLSGYYFDKNRSITSIRAREIVKSRTFPDSRMLESRKVADHLLFIDNILY